jgi:4-hydroxybenzoate polyprenyltransferase
MLQQMFLSARVQDKKDDAVVGVRSTALLFGDKGTKPVLTAFTAAQVS